MLIDGQSSVKLQELQRDAEANKNIYEQFLARYKTTDEQRLLKSSQTKIASAAIPPTRSTRPPLALILAALMIASILTSVAIVSILNRTEKVGGGRDDSGALASTSGSTGNPTRAVAPNQLPAEKYRSDLQRLVIVRGDDPANHPRGLLNKIVDLPGQRGKVALITSVGKDVDKSAVAQLLNSHAVDRGMLSALIQIKPNCGLPRIAELGEGKNIPTWLRATKMDIRALDLLLTRQNDDIRSEFDLIVIDAPSLAEQPEVASISASADLSILVEEPRS